MHWQNTNKKRKEIKSTKRNKNKLKNSKIY